MIISKDNNMRIRGVHKELFVEHESPYRYYVSGSEGFNNQKLH